MKAGAITRSKAMKSLEEHDESRDDENDDENQYLTICIHIHLPPQLEKEMFNFGWHPTSRKHNVGNLTMGMKHIFQYNY